MRFFKIMNAPWLFVLFGTILCVHAADYNLSSEFTEAPYQFQRKLQYPHQRPNGLNPNARLFLPEDISTLSDEAKKHIIKDAFRIKDTQALERLGFIIGPDNNLWHLAIEDWQFVQSKASLAASTIPHAQQNSQVPSAFSWVEEEEHAAAQHSDLIETITTIENPPHARRACTKGFRRERL